MASRSTTPPPALVTTVRSHLARDPFSLGGLLVVFGVVATVGTVREILLAAALLCGALLLPSTLAFVVAQLALVPPMTLELSVAFGLTQLALLAVLTEPAREGSAPLAILGTLAAYVGLAGLVAIGLREGLLVAGGLLCLAVALGVYIARRVTLVRLGVVDTEPKE
jgi:hypothetical protein